MNNYSNLADYFCRQCGDVFLLKKVQEDCAKCIQKVGKSGAEKAAIDDLPQCQSCGLCIAGLKHILCGPCTFHWSAQEPLPEYLTRHRVIHDYIMQYRQEYSIETRRTSQAAPFPLPTPLFYSDANPSTDGPMSSSTSQPMFRMSQGQASPQLHDVLGAASSHQQNASTVRLGVARTPRATNANLGRAAAVRQERQDKKSVNEGRKAQVSCSLARLEPAPMGRKKGLSKVQLTVLAGMQTTACFDFGVNMSDVITDLLTTLKTNLMAREEGRDPAVQTLNYKDASVYILPNARSTGELVNPDKLSCTLGEFLKWAMANGFVGKTPTSVAFKINLRLTYQSQLQITSILASGTNADSATASAFSIGDLRSRSQLSSAFPVPSRQRDPLYSRSPKMENFHFEQLVATYHLNRGEYYDYDFPSSAQIDIAVDWKSGMQASTQRGQGRTKAFNTGFLGQGSSKIAVYARFLDEEYAITFLKEGVMESVEKERLAITWEYELLLQASAFMEEFKVNLKEAYEMNKESKLPTLPEIKFNDGGAFLGKFIIPYQDFPGVTWFLATKLLPCGIAHKPLVKFSGNRAEAEPKSGDITALVVQAFAHFSFKASGGYVYFCDLQGLYDKDEVMTLIDPQCHTDPLDPSEIQADGLDEDMVPVYKPDRAYWDVGIPGIRGLFRSHEKHCHSNWLCVMLGLKTAELEDRFLGEEEAIRPGSIAEDEPEEEDELHSSD